MKKESLTVVLRGGTVVLRGGGILPPRYMVLAMRLGLGGLFIQSAYTKLTTAGGWAASGYLSKATGPLAGLFQSMAGNGLVDGLVMIGELLIGIALVFGAATRWTALAGSAMMVLFYLAKLPPQGTWVSQQIIYLIALNLLAAARAGTFLGIDALLEEWEKRMPVLRYI
ncbi:MAG: DoxX family protein, partial [Chloroflexi bacterium]|nr:DoxX family protein [Chloroflexota bacterium]